MPFVDDTGKVVSPDEVRGHFEPYTEPVAPATVAENVGRVARKVLPRAGAMTAGSEIGAAAGALTPVPGGAEIGAAVGSGLANVAGKYLPESLGGDKSESTLGAFALGAIPEAGARGIAGALERRALRKGADAAHEAIISALDKGPMPAEAAGSVASAVGRTSLARPPVLTGEALTDATNSLRSDILEPINATRKKLGQPIGKAYDALKGNKNTISEPEAKDLQDAAQGVRDEMIAPYPQAKAVFNKIRKWTPPPDPAQGGKLDTLLHRTDEGDYIVKRQMMPEDVDALRLNNFTEEQISKMLEASKHYKPPTLDELRELRQVVNAKIRGAKGGDVHALLGLQQAIDQKLMPHLPEGINRDRELYAGFMRNFEWRDINKVRGMGTPRELANYVFGGTPERTAEIVRGASPQGKQALKEALTNHALDSVNPDAPLDEQVKQVQKTLQPYIANGTAADLYGKDGADELREVFYAPAHRAQMAEMLNKPEQKQAFTNEWMKFVKTANPKQMQAAEAGFQKVLDSLPEPERARFEQAPVPGAEMPVLPQSEESLAKGLTPGKAQIGPRMARRAEFTGPYAAGRAMMGSPAYAAAQLAAMAGIATTSAGYRAFMSNGGAGALARLYASANGRMAARATFEALAAIGAQGAREAVSSPDNQ